MPIRKYELNISCSLGIAVYPRDGTDEATLTMSADKAMYFAKETGRNQSKQVIDMRRADNKTLSAGAKSMVPL
mgnify:CR=1 FL=1